MKLLRDNCCLTLLVYCIIATLIPLTKSDKVNGASAEGNVKDTFKDDVMSDAIFTDNHHRAKRTTYRTTNFYPYGIVPYIFNRRMTLTQKNIIQRVIDHYQNLTCIRFVPRVSSDDQWAKDLFNLGHNGYIEFVQELHCFGGMGNNGGKTLVSCCGRDSCIHELGHSLGLVHEHQNPGSEGFLRVNYDKIPQAQKIRYKVSMEDEVVPGYPFDISSPMSYTYRGDVTVLASDISLETKDFYMFKEISDNHQCPQNNCSNFQMTCVNDGYVTMMYNACACRCPEGLNPQTGCATVLSDDRQDNRCGAVFELNVDNPTVNFKKFANQPYECSWLVNAPEGDTIVLEFHDFDVAKRSGECADEVDIRYSKIGQGGKRFCGTEAPRLIRSYFNRLMITFFPARRPTNSSMFNITAKLIRDESLCYRTSDKGFTYRGTVNFTRDYQKCVNWADAVNCPHNPYKFNDMSAGLDGNYCRNPGDGLRPWCYVFAHTCKRQYCDVCHVDTPYDKATPVRCSSMKAMYNYCLHGTDHEKLECVKKCQEELVPPQPSVSTIRCSRPPAMEDSRQVNKRNKNSFIVGESVTFQCRHPNRIAQTTLKKYCLSTGQWSEGETACLPCHKERGYVLFNNFCYKIETEKKIANEHQARCRLLGGNLADVRTQREQEFITNLAFHHGASSLYIGANDMYREGTFRFRDHSRVRWAPWHFTNRNGPGKDCVTSTPNNEWYANACNERKKAVCKSPMLRHDRRGGRHCRDSREDCADLLSRDPEMCQRDNQAFAFTQCPRTCSVCFNYQFSIIA